MLWRERALVAGFVVLAAAWLLAANARFAHAADEPSPTPSSSVSASASPSPTGSPEGEGDVTAPGVVSIEPGQWQFLTYGIGALVLFGAAALVGSWRR